MLPNPWDDWIKILILFMSYIFQYHAQIKEFSFSYISNWTWWAVEIVLKVRWNLLARNESKQNDKGTTHICNRQLKEKSHIHRTDKYESQSTRAVRASSTDVFFSSHGFGRSHFLFIFIDQIISWIGFHFTIYGSIVWLDVTIKNFFWINHNCLWGWIWIFSLSWHMSFSSSWWR